MFTEIAKCRLCGVITKNLINMNSETLLEVCHRSTGSVRQEEDCLDNYCFKPSYAHICKDGSIGICDVLGFKK